MPPAVDFPSAARGRFARLLAAATAGYSLFLVFATHYPRPEDFLGPNAPPDKVLHFIAYGGLAALAAGTVALARHWTARRAAGLAGVLAAFAAIDEVTQPFFSRASERMDWVFDCVGIVVGLAAVATAVAAVRLVRSRQAQFGVGGR